MATVSAYIVYWGRRGMCGAIGYGLGLTEEKARTAAILEASKYGRNAKYDSASGWVWID